MNARSFRWLLASATALSIVLLLPSWASADEDAAPPPPIAPEARERLAQAAGDAQLAPWQREFMRGLATSPNAATSASDGSWESVISGARAYHSAIYDAANDRMVVFGGADAAAHNDLWSLSLSGTPAWTQLFPVGAAPGVRYAHSAVYDAAHGRMLVFGGCNNSTYYNDVWALSLNGAPVWTPIVPAGSPPSGRFRHSAIYDPANERMLVFGGRTSTTYLNDTWELSLAGPPAWSVLSPSGTAPTPRFGHTAIHDPVRNRMVVFGGYYDASGYWSIHYNDVWSLSLSGAPEWTALSPTGTRPAGRYDHSAVYDPVRDRMLVYAGTDTLAWGVIVGYVNDVWALSLAGVPAWTDVTPAGPTPFAREGHSAIYDAARDRMLEFGGRAQDCFDDLQAMSLSGTPAWSLLSTTGWPPWQRYEHTAIVDAPRQRMIVFGGVGPVIGRSNEVIQYPLSGPSVWASLSPTGTAPTRRSGHSAIFDPVRERMIVFGGYDNGVGYRNDVSALSLSGAAAWTALAPSGTPPTTRYRHSAVYDPVRDRMIVFGGNFSTAYFADVWALSLSGPPAWTRLLPTGTAPAARSGQAAIYDPVRDRLIVFGGANISVSFNDVWALSLAGTPAWTKLLPTGTAPIQRSVLPAIYDPVRDRMLLIGGVAGGFTCYHDVWALSLSGTPAWTALAPSFGPPASRFGHSAAYDPARDRLLVFAGTTGSGLNDLWSLWLGGTLDAGDPPASSRVAGLRAPAPNPTLGATSIGFSLTRAGHARVEVLDVSGRRVRTLLDGMRPASDAVTTWDGADDSGRPLGGGIYFVRLTAPGVAASKRVVRLR